MRGGGRRREGGREVAELGDPPPRQRRCEGESEGESEGEG